MSTMRRASAWRANRELKWVCGAPRSSSRRTSIAFSWRCGTPARRRRFPIGSIASTRPATKFTCATRGASATRVGRGGIRRTTWSGARAVRADGRRGPRLGHRRRRPLSPCREPRPDAGLRGGRGSGGRAGGLRRPLGTGDRRRDPSRPPRSHSEDGAPPLLNVLRVCDIPDVLGMLSPRPLRIETAPTRLGQSRRDLRRRRPGR